MNKNKDYDKHKYAIESLPDDYLDVYKIIRAYVGTGTQSPYNDSNKRNKERQLFKKENTPSGKEEEEFYTAFCHYSNLETPSVFMSLHNEGAGKKSCDAILRASAYINEVSVTEQFATYIKNTNDLRQKKIFKDVEDVIQNIINDIDDSDYKKKDLNLLEEDVIIKKIDEFSKKLGFYPYGKDTLPKMRIPLSESIISEIDRLLDSAHGNIHLLSYKANLLCLIGQLEESLKIAEDLYQKNSDHIKAIAAYAFVLYRMGDPKKSFKMVEKGLKLSPNNISLLMRRGVASESIGKIEIAIDTYLKLIELDEDHFFPYYRLGLIYKRIGNLDSAVHIFEKALEISPNDKNIINEYHQCKYPNIEDQLSKNIDAADQYLGQQLNEAMHYLYNNNFQYAETILLEAINQFDSNPLIKKGVKAVFYSAYAFGLERRYSVEKKDEDVLRNALEYCLSSLELNPSFYETLVMTSKIYFLLNDSVNSKKYIEKASDTEEHREYFIIRKDSNHDISDPYHQLHEDLKENYKTYSYIIPLEWCVEKHPSCIKCYILLASEYISSDNIDKARSFFYKAQSLAEKLVIEKKVTLKDAVKNYHTACFLDFLGDYWPDKRSHLNIVYKILELCCESGIKNVDKNIWQEMVGLKKEVYDKMLDK